MADRIFLGFIGEFSAPTALAAPEAGGVKGGAGRSGGSRAGSRGGRGGRSRGGRGWGGYGGWPWPWPVYDGSLFSAYLQPDPERARHLAVWESLLADAERAQREASGAP